MITRLLLLLIFCCFGQLRAQDSTRTSAPQRVDIAQNNQQLIQQQGLGGNLITGTGLTITNPGLEYEVDDKKAYLVPELQPYVITLLNGAKATFPARIRLIDQVVEVKQGDKDLEVKTSMLRSAVSPEGRRFEPLAKPLIEGDPTPLVEVLAEYDNIRLLSYHRSIWREPSQAKTSYNNDNYKKKLYREAMFFLEAPAGITRIRSIKKLIKVLPPASRTKAQRYAKAQRLRAKREDLIALMNHIDS